MLTKRDQAILNFLDKEKRNCKIANTSEIHELFFKPVSLNYCQKRMTELYNQLEELDRCRNFVNEEYMYWVNKKPKQIKHCLTYTNFLKELNKVAHLQNYIGQKTYEEYIVPDGLIKYNNMVALVEVHISRNKFNIDKYKKFLYSGDYKKHFTGFPLVIVITNRNLPKCNDIQLIKIREDCKNIKDLL